MGVAADFAGSGVDADGRQMRDVDPGPVVHSLPSPTSRVPREGAEARTGAATIVASSPSTIQVDTAAPSTTLPRPSPPATSMLVGKGPSAPGERDPVQPTVPAHEPPVKGLRYDQVPPRRRCP